MGPYLNQLITIEVGMSTFVKDPPEHVNFSKLERVRNQVDTSTPYASRMFTSMGISTVFIAVISYIRVACVSH